MRDQTTRVNVANAKLARHRAEVLGFLEAYKKSVDWAYSTPVALQAYAKLSDQSVEFAKYIVKEFASKESNQLDEIKGEDRVLAETLTAKRIPPRFDPRGHRRSLSDFVASLGGRSSAQACLTNCCVALWSLLAHLGQASTIRGLRVRHQGYSCRAALWSARQFMTHSDWLAPSIDALQTAYSISPHQLGTESPSKGQRHSWKRC